MANKQRSREDIIKDFSRLSDEFANSLPEEMEAGPDVPSLLLVAVTKVEEGERAGSHMVGCAIIGDPVTIAAAISSATDKDLGLARAVNEIKNSLRVDSSAKEQSVNGLMDLLKLSFSEKRNDIL